MKLNHAADVKKQCVLGGGVKRSDGHAGREVHIPVVRRRVARL